MTFSPDQGSLLNPLIQVCLLVADPNPLSFFSAGSLKKLLPDN
jgi:hypothetical protein